MTILNYCEAFEQGVIEGLPTCPVKQSASDKTTISLYSTGEFMFSNTGGRPDSPIRVWLKWQAPPTSQSVCAQVLIRFPSDGRDNGISLKRISRPYHFC